MLEARQLSQPIPAGEVPARPPQGAWGEAADFQPGLTTLDPREFIPQEHASRAQTMAAKIDFQLTMYGEFLPYAKAEVTEQGPQLPSHTHPIRRFFAKKDHVGEALREMETVYISSPAIENDKTLPDHLSASVALRDRLQQTHDDLLRRAANIHGEEMSEIYGRLAQAIGAPVNRMGSYPQNKLMEVSGGNPDDIAQDISDIMKAGKRMLVAEGITEGASTIIAAALTYYLKDHIDINVVFANIYAELVYNPALVYETKNTFEMQEKTGSSLDPFVTIADKALKNAPDELRRGIMTGTVVAKEFAIKDWIYRGMSFLPNGGLFYSIASTLAAGSMVARAMWAKHEVRKYIAEQEKTVDKSRPSVFRNVRQAAGD